MNRHNFICPKCEITRRSRTGGTCHRCGNELIGIGDRWRVPKKGKWGGFIELLKKVNPYFKDKIENYGSSR